MYLDSCTRALSLSPSTRILPLSPAVTAAAAAITLPAALRVTAVTAILDTIILAVKIVVIAASVIVINIIVINIVVGVSIRIVSAFDVTVLAPGQILRFNTTELQEK
jgi:hypothetical protein